MAAGEDDANFVREWAAVVRAVDAVQHASSARLETMGISLPYHSVLTMLLAAEEQRLPMSRIARDLSMTSAGFTKLADRMARDGLIDRRGSSGDRRVVFAALTDTGLEQARKADEAYRAFLRDEVLHTVSEAELTALSTIVERLGQLKGEPDPEPFALASPQRHGSDRRTRR